WFLLGIGMLLGAIFPVALEWLAKAMGVRDVTIALFSVTLLILLALSLNFSVIASRQSKQITRLAQQQAIDGVEEEAASPAASSRGETPAPREQAPR
nr:DUF2304 domain-containing protein [Solirubrobacterales bacterium]